MSDLNVTEGEWVASTGSGNAFVDNGTMVIADCDIDILPVDEIKSNAYLLAQAKNMYEKLTYLNKLLLSLGPEVWDVTDLGAESNSIEQLLNACKPPERNNEL